MKHAHESPVAADNPSRRPISLLAGALLALCLSGAAWAQAKDPPTVAKLRIIGLTADSFVWVDGTLVPTPASDTLSLALGVHRVSVWEEGFLPVENAVVTVREDDSASIVFQRLKSHLVRADKQGAWANGVGIAGGILSIGGLALVFASIQAWDEDADPYSHQNDPLIVEGRIGLAASAAGIVLDVSALILGWQAKAEKSKHLDFEHFAIYAELTGK